MNILIAADYATPAGGNFVASCVELGRALRKNGDGITFIFRRTAIPLRSAPGHTGWSGRDIRFIWPKEA